MVSLAGKQTIFVMWMYFTYPVFIVIWPSDVGKCRPGEILLNLPFACLQQASRRRNSFVWPVVRTGSARDRGSFRVCLISTTCLPVTRGSLPRSGVERENNQVNI